MGVWVCRCVLVRRFSSDARSCAFSLLFVDVVFLDILLALLGRLLGRRRRRRVAVLGRRVDAAQSFAVEDEAGRALLETRVASLALPVAVAGLAQRRHGGRVIGAQSCVSP